MNNYYSPSTNQCYQNTDQIDYLKSGGVPPDSVLISDDLAIQVLAGLQNYQTISVVPATDSTPATVQINPFSIQDIINQNEAAIQAHMDAEALTQGYTTDPASGNGSIESACKYASSQPFVIPFNATPIQKAIATQQELYRQQGVAAVNWVSLTWATAYAYIGSVMAGENPMPTQAECIAMIPPIKWPTIADVAATMTTATS